jgi:CRP-like cAMP-binding protein
MLAVRGGTAIQRKALRVVREGERTNPAGKPVRNKILLSIPDDEYDLIRPHLEFLVMPHHLSLHEPSQKLKFAYFTSTGLISMVVVVEDGRTVEAGVVGKEGMAGGPSVAGLSRSFLRAIVQIKGEGFRMGVGALQSALPSAPQFHLSLNRFAAIQGFQVAQTAACNRLHTIEQRLARWLLMAQDRVDSDWLGITHDFLATMLGTDRPTVSLAASVLQKKGAIQYVRAAVKVVNRRRLEASSCECYGAIQQFNGELGLK